MWNSASFFHLPPEPKRSHIRTATFMPAQRKRLIEAERLGFDTAWIAEHHFATSYASCRVLLRATWPISRPRPAASTSAPRSSPCRSTIRSVWSRTHRSSTSCRTAASGLGVGSGYRPYEFEGLGRDFENRRDMVEEAIGLMFDARHRHRWDHKGKYFAGTGEDQYRDAAASGADAASAALYGGRHRPLDRLQRAQRLRPHALDPAGCRDARGTDRALQARASRRRARSGGRIPRRATSTSRAGSTSPTAMPRRAPTPRKPSSSTSRISAARVPAAISARCRRRARRSTTTTCSPTTLLHGSAETVIARLHEMQARTGMTSLLLHYPPYYGREKTMQSLKLFAERVIPAFRPPARRAVAAE